MFPSSIRIFVAVQPTDLRKGFDGLAGLVEGMIGEDVYAGHLYVFFNRRGTHVKILWWDRSGFALWYKRLERGVFRVPKRGDRCLELAATDLAMILDGIDLASVKRQRRYQRSQVRA